MTCPCRQFDFISRHHHTEQTFKDILLFHRQQSLRVVHEFLLGPSNIQHTLDLYEQEKTSDDKKADQQLLYQHLTQCSVAIQLLLNRTPHYWCFIPMTDEEADKDDQVNSSKEFQYEGSPRERTDDETEWYFNHLPQPPLGTRFSQYQQKQQKFFFKHGYDLLCLPPRHLDLFDMAPIFICKFLSFLFNIHFLFFVLVPDNCSTLLSEVIESLLITHAECKLNTTGHLYLNPHLTLETMRLIKNPSWFKNLLGRPLNPFSLSL